VLNGKVYDANGYEFRMRGVDRCHFDSNSAAGITRSGANAVRFFMYDIGVSGGPATSSFYDVALNQHIANKQMPIITAANVAGTHTGSSGDTSSADLATIVSWWVSNESVFAPIMDKISINIANEWGPSNSATWETAYESAITDLRNAGYTCPLVIDTGGSGQDDQDLLNYAQDVFNSDPQKNIIFSIHLYGGANDYSTGIQSVHQGTNTVVTLASNSATHPFAPNFDGTNNSYSGISAYSFSGVQGMTQLNGEQPAPQNVGGSQGAWTITLSVDSTSWPAYTGGGTVVDYNGNYQLRLARLAALGQSTGAAIIVGEFGPGRNIGPSPTLVTPDEIISASEANQLGWLAWAWDDNNLGGGQTNNAWFGMTYNGPGVYAVDSDLTMFGQQIVEGCINPAPGGCGCPDSPVPDDSVVAPGCQGTPAPEYSNYSLKLAQPATVY